MQDGSAPAGMRAIAQTADGFLWFASLSRGIYRFDGVRFVPWLLLAGLSSIDQHNMNVCERYANHRGVLLRGRNCVKASDSSHVADLPLVGQPG